MKTGSNSFGPHHVLSKRGLFYWHKYHLNICLIYYTQQDINKPSIHITVASCSISRSAYSQLQFSGCSTQQSHSILEEKQVRRITFIHHHRLGRINAHRDHVCRSLSRLNDFSNISLGSLLSGTQAPCRFTAVMVDYVVDAICLWLGFCCELNLVVRSMDEYGLIMRSYWVDEDCRYLNKASLILFP